MGYVGLLLSIEFAKEYKVIGFDTIASRVKELKKGEVIKKLKREINPDLFLSNS